MATTVGDKKNGTTSSQVPKNLPWWSDEKGISVMLYEALVLLLEIILLNIRISLAWVYAFYEMIVPKEPKDVSNEIVLITGAGHGIGQQMALQFASLGATIVCVDINPKGNKETADMVKGINGKVYTFECDVTDRTSVFNTAENIRATVGDVTILINNAGIMPCRPFLTHSENEVRTMFDVNIVSHVWTTQAFLPAMMQRNHGHIVAMSSMAGMLGLRNLVPYCASKFAVRGFMEALHEELREDARDFAGIKFTVVYPYIVDTGLCKNPKIKFPSMMRVVSPDEAATHIIKAIRLDEMETSIPSSLYYVNKVCRALPYRVPMLIKDFLDSGLDSHH